MNDIAYGVHSGWDSSRRIDFSGNIESPKNHPECCSVALFDLNSLHLLDRSDCRICSTDFAKKLGRGLQDGHVDG